MKKALILAAFIGITAIYSSVQAQQTAPPGAGDKNLRDNNVKSRSVELERVERETEKNKNNPANPAIEATAAAEDRLAAKYAEIKTDYEQIQLSQDVIIKAFQGTSKIDYAQISKSALEINTSATRLNANLFPETTEEKSAAKKAEQIENAKKNPQPVRTVRDLIVDLDNTIGSFATSPMFQNLRTIDAAVAAKARLELEKIIELSAMLDTEARKMSGVK